MTEFDKEKFAELLYKAKGKRSINNYALKSGVTSAHISRLLRGLLDTAPTPPTIKKLADHAQNDVTYEDLMKAAGHIENNYYIKEDIPSYVREEKSTYNIPGEQLLTPDDLKVLEEIKKHPVLFHDLANAPEKKIKQLIKMWEFIKKDLDADDEDDEDIIDD